MTVRIFEQVIYTLLLIMWTCIPLTWYAFCIQKSTETRSLRNLAVRCCIFMRRLYKVYYVEVSLKKLPSNFYEIWYGKGGCTKSY